MNIKLKLDYTKEYLPNKELKAKVDYIAFELTRLQYDFGDDNTFGKLITSDLANKINDILPLVIPEEQYAVYSKNSNNLKRKILIKGIFGAFRNKLVVDKVSMCKNFETRDYYSKLKISGWDLLKQIFIAMIAYIEVNKTSKNVEWRLKVDSIQ
jgi:hypothetical protein